MGVVGITSNFEFDLLEIYLKRSHVAEKPWRN